MEHMQPVPTDRDPPGAEGKKVFDDVWGLRDGMWKSGTVFRVRFAADPPNLEYLVEWDYDPEYENREATWLPGNKVRCLPDFFASESSSDSVAPEAEASGSDSVAPEAKAKRKR